MICDTSNTEGNGLCIIISPTFVAGRRFMKQWQDALAFVMSYGSPDFYITYTMNPKWEELTEAVLETGSRNTPKP